MKKRKRIKEVCFLWYHKEFDYLFELNRESTNDVVLLKAMENMYNVAKDMILIGLIEVKYAKQ